MKVTRLNFIVTMKVVSYEDNGNVPFKKIREHAREDIRWNLYRENHWLSLGEVGAISMTKIKFLEEVK